MPITTKLLTLSAATAALFALSACNQQDDPTVGQTMDRTIVAAKSEMKDAKEATKDAAATISTAASDAAITTKINAALIADDQLKALQIDVDTKAGKVVLNGTAPDAAARDRALSLAQSVDGVVAVDNRLTVQPKG